MRRRTGERGRGWTRGLLALLGAVACVLAVAPRRAEAAGECLLLMEGVAGDSADAQHRDAIDLLGWSWEVVAHPASTRPGGPAPGAGRAEFHPFRFAHAVDRATPVLFQLAATGRRVPSATLVCRRPGPRPAEYLRLTLFDVLVSGVRIADPTDRPPSEEVLLGYERLSMQYRAQMPDGSLAPPVVGTWDLRTNHE